MTEKVHVFFFTLLVIWLMAQPINKILIIRRIFQGSLERVIFFFDGGWGIILIFVWLENSQLRKKEKLADSRGIWAVSFLWQPEEANDQFFWQRENESANFARIFNASQKEEEKNSPKNTFFRFLPGLILSYF